MRQEYEETVFVLIGHEISDIAANIVKAFNLQYLDLKLNELDQQMRLRDL